jgi:hypothetical protein
LFLPPTPPYYILLYTFSEGLQVLEGQKNLWTMVLGLCEKIKSNLQDLEDGHGGKNTGDPIKLYLTKSVYLAVLV